MPNIHRSTFHQTDRELNAALDELGNPGHKAPVRIPVGKTQPKQRGYRRFKIEMVQARKRFCEIDARYASGVKAQVALQLYAEEAYDSSNPEDALIDMIDRKHDTLGKLLCKIADRAPRHVVHHG